MNLVFFQRLDREGGGSRASLGGTLRAIRQERPEWNLALVTGEGGPLSRMAGDCGVTLRFADFPRFRKVWEKPAFWWDCWILAGRLNGISPSGILSNEWITAPHALAVARRLGIPAMSYVRDFAAVERGRKYQLHKMNRLLCVCESMRQALIRVGHDPQKVYTVYNPVLRPTAGGSNPMLRSRILGHAGVDRWLLYVGRISPRKNQIGAIETLRRLREITGQRWGLLLAGDADEAYAAEVSRAAEAACLNEVVLQLGMIHEPGWLFELADASILTSNSEGLARVLIESFLCGTPGFSFPLDGLEDIYGRERAFFTSDTREPKDLAGRIAIATAGGAELRERVERLKAMLEIRHSRINHVAALEAALYPSLQP